MLVIKQNENIWKANRLKDWKLKSKWCAYATEQLQEMDINPFQNKYEVCVITMSLKMGLALIYLLGSSVSQKYKTKAKGGYWNSTSCCIVEGEENKHTDDLHGRFHICCGLFQQWQQLGGDLMHRFNVAKQAIHVQPINLKNTNTEQQLMERDALYSGCFPLLNSKRFIWQLRLLSSTISVSTLI